MLRRIGAVLIVLSVLALTRAHAPFGGRSELLTGTGGLAPPPVDFADIRPLVNYLVTHRRGERFLLATSHLMLAALIIVETGEPVIATGGFLGTDPVLTPDKGADMVAARQLRYVLISPVTTSRFSLPAGGADDRGSAPWRIVSPSLWRPEAHGSVPNAILPGPERIAVRSGLLASRMGQTGVVRLQLRQMELCDCRPDSDGPASNQEGSK